MSLDTAKAVAQLRSLTATFKIGVETASPMYPRICTPVQSDGKLENYGGLGAVSSVREWLGDRVFNGLRAATFIVPNKEWEWSHAIERTDLEDDTMGLYTPIFQAGAQEFAHHPDTLLITDCLIGGDSLECFDGQSFYDTDHSWGDSGTQSNKITSVAADPDNPTLAEMRTALGAARLKMLRYKNDKGNLFMRNALTNMEGMLAIAPPEMQQTMSDALIPITIGTTPTKLVNPPEVMALGQLSDVRSFYLNYTGAPLKPFLFQKRRPLQMQMKGQDDREFKDVKFMADARYAVAPFAWWYSVKVTFVGA